MRIRRRPQPSPSPSSSSPSFLLLHSDPSTSQQTPRNAERGQERRGGAVGEEEGRRPPHLHANADLGHKSAVARRLALPPPQDNAAGCAQQGADDLQGRGLVNGNGGADWKVACTGRLGEEQAVEMERPVSNGVAAPAVTMPAVTDEKINGSDGTGGSATKKRRGAAVLLEGSRCSRVNGRGWRCSQPTLVGYSLCEHHLGKGRMRAATAAASTGGGVGRGGPGQLGRTEHRARIPVVAVSVGAVVTAASSKAEEPGLGRY